MISLHKRFRLDLRATFVFALVTIWLCIPRLAALEVESVGLKIELRQLHQISPTDPISYRILLRPKFPIAATVEYELEVENVKIKTPRQYQLSTLKTGTREVWELQSERGSLFSTFRVSIKSMLGDRKIIDHQILELESGSPGPLLLEHADLMASHLARAVKGSSSLVSSYKKESLINSLLGWALVTLVFLGICYRKSPEKESAGLFGSLLVKLFLVLVFPIQFYLVESFTRDAHLERSGWEVTLAKISNIRKVPGLGVFVDYKIKGLDQTQVEYLPFEPSFTDPVIRALYCIEDPAINSIWKLYRFEDTVYVAIFYLLVLAILYFNGHYLEADSEKLKGKNLHIPHLLLPFTLMFFAGLLGLFLLEYGQMLWLITLAYMAG
ncbi:hypothetical protein HOF92_10660 [bacterium]|nr:hypothetical protein [bacterium]